MLPGAGISGFAESPISSNCSAAASSPSLPSSSQPGASTASPTTSVCSSRTSRDAFVTPGNSPELVISGHLRQLGRSLDCTSVASPRFYSDTKTGFICVHCPYLYSFFSGRMMRRRRTCHYFKLRQQRTGQLGAVRGTRLAWTS